MIARALIPWSIPFVALLAACPDENGTDDAGPNDTGMNDAAASDRDQDGHPDDADNCPELANEDQSDRDDDGTGDLCDPCRFTSNTGSCTSYPSVEPDDAPEQALPIAIPALAAVVEILGTIEAPTGGIQAIDRFRLIVPEDGVLVSLVMEALDASPLQPYFSMTGAPWMVSRAADGEAVAERQIFFPLAGEYELIVSDRRNPPMGGDAFAYAVGLQREQIEISTISLPDLREVHEEALEIAGRVLFYRLSQPPAFEWFRVETETELGRSQASVGVDSVLGLIGGQFPYWETDNLARDLVDAKIVAPSAFDMLVLDHHRQFGTDDRVKLVVGYNQFLETEPNDAADSATPINLPGLIDAQLSTPAPVEDWFTFEAPAGTLLAITAMAWPRIESNIPIIELGRLSGSTFEPMYRTRRTSPFDGRNDGHAEVILDQTDTYYFRITEESGQNFTPELCAMFGGGDGCRYVLIAPALPASYFLDAAPLVASSTLASGKFRSGASILRAFLIDPPTETHLVVTTASAADGVEPRLRLYASDRFDMLIAEGLGDLDRVLAPQPVPYVLVVNNDNFSFIDPDTNPFSFQLDVRFDPP